MTEARASIGIGLMSETRAETGTITTGKVREVITTTGGAIIRIIEHLRKIISGASLAPQNRAVEGIIIMTVIIAKTIIKIAETTNTRETTVKSHTRGVLTLRRSASTRPTISTERTTTTTTKVGTEIGTAVAAIIITTVGPQRDQTTT